MEALDPGELESVRRLAGLVAPGPRARAARGSDLAELPALYRRVSTLYLRGAGRAQDAATQGQLEELLARAHAALYRAAPPAAAGRLRRALHFLLETSPRAVRDEWKLLLALLFGFYGLAGAAWIGVGRDFALAYSLFDEGAVAITVEQLRSTARGEPFRGNFTFGLGESPSVAGRIFAHNIFVAILFFGSALVPPLFLFLFATNALMVGTYTGLAGHWDQAGAISSILWCHGVLELQMIVLASAAGLVLVRALVAPGSWSRRAAMARESRRAWELFAPVPCFLVISGLIEGYVSPHAPLGVRAATALASALLLGLWILGPRRARGRAV